MPKIQDIINDFQVSREEIGTVYKKTIGKALPARAVNLKDEEWTLLEKSFKKGSKAAAPAPKESKDESKVIKSDELFGGDDFLSGLGFGPKAPVEEEKEEDVISSITKEAEAEPEEMKVSFGNARVIVSAPPREPRKPFVRRESPAAAKPADDK